jgi:hypothetical protein
VFIYFPPQRGSAANGRLYREPPAALGLTIAANGCTARSVGAECGNMKGLGMETLPAVSLGPHFSLDMVEMGHDMYLAPI